MKKEAFFKQLEYLLQDVSEADKEEALAYYRDYLDEAGPEKEEEVLAGFGSPERIASMIRADLSGSLEEGGSFTENGYEDERFRDPNYQLAKRLDLPERAEKKAQESDWNQASDQNWNTQNHESMHTDGKRKPRTSKSLKLILVVILLVMASPMILGLGGGLLGILVAVIAAAAALLLAAGIVTAALLFSGIVAVIAGIASLLSNPVTGVFAVGAGLLILGAGGIALVISVWVYGKLIPWGFRGLAKCLDSIGNWIRRRRV